jgi:hypothetical protein
MAYTANIKPASVALTVNEDFTIGGAIPLDNFAVQVQGKEIGLSHQRSANEGWNKKTIRVRNSDADMAERVNDLFVSENSASGYEVAF